MAENRRKRSVTPAMAAGVTDRLCEMSDVVDVLEAFEAAQKRAAKLRRSHS
jgi:hypothetical protein